MLRNQGRKDSSGHGGVYVDSTRVGLSRPIPEGEAGGGAFGMKVVN